jgi:hypothetical protein
MGHKSCYMRLRSSATGSCPRGMLPSDIFLATHPISLGRLGGLVEADNAIGC